MTYIEKLVDIGGPALSAARGPMPIAVRHEGGPLAEQLDHLLMWRNGFFAFESALHVLPLGPSDFDVSLAQWNAADSWRSAYGDLARERVFFAEDIFGNQFSISSAGVCSFDAETAEATFVASDLERWAESVLDNYDYLTGFPFAHDWQIANGALQPGHRLVPIQPFVLGGEYSVANLRPVAAIRGMKWRGELASQIHNLPDGATVTVRSLD